MSYWFDVDKDDIELSDDGKTLNVRIDDHNHDWGNMYAQLPIDRVRELVAPSGWKDVREELPAEEGRHVLLWMGEQKCYSLGYRRGNEIINMIDGYYCKPTHWAPMNVLPSPPEGVQS